RTCAESPRVRAACSMQSPPKPAPTMTTSESHSVTRGMLSGAGSATVAAAGPAEALAIGDARLLRVPCGRHFDEGANSFGGAGGLDWRGRGKARLRRENHQ